MGTPEAFLNVQKNIRENASEVQNYLSGLSEWSQEMRAAELARSSDPITPLTTTEVPVRSASKGNKNKRTDGDVKLEKEKDPQPVKPKIPVPATDYNSWEKFDVEKACKEVDKEVKPKKVETEEEIIKRRAIELRLKTLAQEKKEMGNNCLKAKQYDKAVEYYSEGISCDKKNSVLYANRAQAYVYLKEFEKAATDCTTAIAQDPLYVKAYFRRAKANFSLGKLVDAKNDLDQTLKMEPGNQEAKQLLNDINRKTMQSLFAPSSQSAPATPSTQSNNNRNFLFPGIQTKLRTPLILHPDEEDDVEEVKDVSVYPKIIKPIYKPPAKRSKRPLLPVHVKVIGGNGSVSSSEEGNGEKKKMRLDFNANVGETSGDTTGTPQLPAHSPSTSLPTMFSQIQLVKENKSSHLPAFQTQDLPPLPKTAAQFALDWRKIKGSPDLCSRYLLQMKHDNYKIFGESLEYNRLSEILEVLVWEFLPRGWDISEHLEGLASLPRFSTLAMFMTEKDRANARKLISECPPSTQPHLSEKYALL